MARDRLNFQPDVTTLGCEFFGIQQQVEENLLQTGWVNIHPNRLVRNRHMEFLSMFLKQRSESFDCLSDQRCQFHDTFVKFDLATADARHVQQIINQSLEVLDLPLDRRQLPLGACLSQSPPFQQIDGCLDRCQGVAEFVRKHRQKFLLAAVRFPEFFFRAQSVGDVNARPDVPGESAVWCESRNSGIHDPAVFAIMPL